MTDGEDPRYTVIGGYDSHGQAQPITVLSGLHEAGMVTRDGWVITITAASEHDASEKAAGIVGVRQLGQDPAPDRDFTVVGYWDPTGKPRVIAVVPGLPALQPVHAGRWAVSIRAISASAAADKAVSRARALLGERSAGQDI